MSASRAVELEVIARATSSSPAADLSQGSDLVTLVAKLLVPRLVLVDFAPPPAARTAGYQSRMTHARQEMHCPGPPRAKKVLGVSGTPSCPGLVDELSDR